MDWSWAANGWYVDIACLIVMALFVIMMFAIGANSAIESVNLPHGTGFGTWLLYVTYITVFVIIGIAGTMIHQEAQAAQKAKSLQHSD